ncbi:hypothetical protein [Sphingobium yanoikuyae]|nr:hypothetical protein [Sphingobium yanoikuyae]MDV3480839.1 hypothetical protein [Sphingobium yanoikuyae]
MADKEKLLLQEKIDAEGESSAVVRGCDEFSSGPLAGKLAQLAGLHASI